MPRKVKQSALGAAIAAFLMLFASPAYAQAPEGMEATVTGTVVDISCKFGRGATGEGHRTCAQVCADAGIPLAVLTDDGKLYVPIGGKPGETQNELLKEFAEQKVTVTGMVFTAGDAHVIHIKDVKKA